MALRDAVVAASQLASRCRLPGRVPELRYRAGWIPCRVGYHAARDTMPRGIPCRVGYHAAWDTMPRGIPCHVGYHAAWDTMPRGIPCRVGYRARGIPCSGDTVLGGLGQVESFVTIICAAKLDRPGVRFVDFGSGSGTPPPPHTTTAPPPPPLPHPTPDPGWRSPLFDGRGPASAAPRSAHNSEDTLEYCTEGAAYTTVGTGTACNGGITRKLRR